jgi:hypothetical protein
MTLGSVSHSAGAPSFMILGAVRTQSTRIGACATQEVRKASPND